MCIPAAKHTEGPTCAAGEAVFRILQDWRGGCRGTPRAPASRGLHQVRNAHHSVANSLNYACTTSPGPCQRLPARNAEVVAPARASTRKVSLVNPQTRGSSCAVIGLHF